ncbi:Kinase superfamily protein [Tripterygium wilfordii]|uniref:Kinase superfamily protein n=1 Tax=Tripterygium wilfordii TaxID=458696 RepID=A0A7J7D310_TRIWF|nr:wall-associated receptor kinase-like 14 [Tripterygium wilfordii]KAF5740730.1 Kinase superfamily protein [Tripterygium wilfordii]
MTLKDPILLLLALSVFSLNRVVHASTKCNRTCGNHEVFYPFGFSDGCQIRLNCTEKGERVINGLTVQSLTTDSIKIAIGAECNRSPRILHNLYTDNYAPTNSNAILLHNCRNTAMLCDLPSIDVKTRFEGLDCNSNNSSNISCYSGTGSSGFLNYDNMTRIGCQYLLSVISAQVVDPHSFNDSGVSLDLRVVELGWWLNGKCDCSANDACIPLRTPAGRQGYRCQCKEGFEGDGYPGSTGCRPKDSSSHCNAANYFSRRCGGTTIFSIVVGGIAFGALLICFCLVCCFMRRSSSAKSKGYVKRLSEATGVDIPVYGYKEIEKATNNFSEKQRLGTGAYGTVYAGKLQTDLWVAIKRIRRRDTDSTDQVMNEIKLISSVCHPNLVRLLGCSIENGEQILVYEFMPNGTLCQHLQGERGDGLAWPIRLSIAYETAQAIAHLHSAMSPPIYHRDIKSSNILLDYNFRSKVADFGLSRLGRPEISHISTAPQGTPGYVDPDYHQNFHVSDKSDVYSFGVVLVEIITSLKAVDFSRPLNEVTLAALATDRIVKGQLTEIIDPFIDIHSDAWTFSSVHKVAELAFRCLASHKEMRPSMIEVAAELEQIRLSRWTPPEEIKYAASSDVSSAFSISSAKLQSLCVKNGGLSPLQTGNDTANLTEREKEDSPVSIQDPWPSEQSSSSSNSLPNNVVIG